MRSQYSKLLELAKETALWLIGLFIMLMGIVALPEGDIFGGLLLLFAGLLAIPNTYTLIKQKIPFQINQGIRILAIFILFVVGVPLYPDIESTPVAKHSSVTSQEVQEELIVNTNIQETAQETYKVLSITDGDTIRVERNGNSIPIRLIGIDSPEIKHPSEPVHCYGPEAKTKLEELILNKEIILEKDISDVDKYDRYLRYIWLDEILINEYMTAEGYAFASSYPPDTKYQERINSGEMTAKIENKGLWAITTCKGNVYTGTYKDPNKVIELPPAQITQPTAPEPITVETPPVYIPPTPTYVAPASPYTCNCSKTCSKMASCKEAYYQLNTCGCSARDGDNDGIPCESICK